MFRSRFGFFVLLLLGALTMRALPASAATPISYKHIESVSFESSTTGYIGGFYSPAGFPTGFLSRTSDGGVSWESTLVTDRTVVGVAASPLRAPMAISAYTDYVYRLAQTGYSWSRGGNILSTGTSYDTQPYDVFSSADSSISVVVGQQRNQPAGKVAFIATSNDDGATWVKRLSGPVYLDENEHVLSGTEAHLKSVDMAGSNGWAVGVNWFRVGDYGDWYYKPGVSGLAYRTNDSGSTWTTVTVTQTSQEPLVDVAVTPDPAIVYILQSLESGARIVKTSNGGATWGTLGATGQEMFDIATVGTGTVVAVGAKGMIRRSFNGGTTWTQWAHPAYRTLRGISILDADSWIVVGDEECILRTDDAGATWRGTSSPTAPTVVISAPVSGFPLNAGPVPISCVASDTGVGVATVEVRVRRADGLTWGGPILGWTSADTWLACTLDDRKQWVTTWTPDPATIALGSLVTVSARARDGLGLASTEPQVSSGSPVFASATLSGGAAVTTLRFIDAAVASTGATHVRYRVGEDAVGAWAPMSPVIPVVLADADGTQTVTFEFSRDGAATVSALAVDSILLHRSVPVLSVSTPSSGFSLLGGSVTVAGSATDAGGTIHSVDVLIRRADGRTWDGSSWAQGEIWTQATTSDGYASWSLDWTPDDEIKNSDEFVTIEVKAVDAVGLQSPVNAIESDAPVTASLSLAGGRAVTADTQIRASISATGSPTSMRFSVDADAPGSWVDFASTATVTIAAVEGTHSVRLDVSSDGGLTFNSATDTIMLHTSLPTVTFTAPSTTFAWHTADLAVNGTASDSGGSVSAVRLRYQRSDGFCWDGSGWVAYDAWVSAQSADGFAHWTSSSPVSAAELVPDAMLTVSARAVDGYGLESPAISVASAPVPKVAVSLAGGAVYQSSSTVTATVVSGGLGKVRYRIDEGQPTPWAAVASTQSVNEIPVTLPAGDANRRVTFEFTDDVSHVRAVASDAITRDTVGPTLSFTAPAASFALTGTVYADITAADAGAGVQAVDVCLTRAGLYWNGAEWQSQKTWLLAQPQDSFWRFVWDVDALSQAGTVPVTLVAVARDSVGNSSSEVSITSVDRPDLTTLKVPIASAVIGYGGGHLVSGTLSSGGSPVSGRSMLLQYSSSPAGPYYGWTVVATSADGRFAFPVVRPTSTRYYRVRFPGDSQYAASSAVVVKVMPKAYVTTPRAPLTVSKGVAFAVSGYLKPRHTTGSYPIRLYCYRYQRTTSGTYTWVLRKTQYARAYYYSSSATKYYTKLKLPYSGTWMVKAGHADAGHAATYSAGRRITAR